ncbi:MAG: phosphatase PAP2 family protein [Candidatus Aminicenantes bacterium]|nr:phosphatase PAP2 family protein [Candidatus Aminicenantes bacterium]
MRKKHLLASLLVLCCFCGQLLFAAAADDSQAGALKESIPPAKEKKESYFSNFIKDDVEIWTAPFNLDLKGSLLFVAILAGTGVLIANDEAIYKGFKNYQNNHPWVDTISPKASFLGDWGIDCGIAGLFVLSGLAFKDKKARDTGLMALETMMHTGLLAQVFKHLAGRQRPSAEDGQDYWFGPGAFFNRYREGSFARYDAFLSGHTISAWGLATVIAENYKNHFWVPLACYGLATVVGLSRLTEDTHWFSDVFVGAVLGYVIGRMVVRNRNRRLQIAPSVTAGGMGLSVSYLFQ